MCRGITHCIPPGNNLRAIGEAGKEISTTEEAESFLRDNGWRKAYTEDEEFLGWCKPWVRPVSVLELNEALAVAKKKEFPA